ncbi:MAG TPA: hypothetical protein VKD22_11520 [Ramlibacter sp.]|nr:hypothetical protein [Ramlibacter sp.]
MAHGWPSRLENLRAPQSVHIRKRGSDTHAGPAELEAAMALSNKRPRRNATPEEIMRILIGEAARRQHARATNAPARTEACSEAYAGIAAPLYHTLSTRDDLRRALTATGHSTERFVLLTFCYGRSGGACAAVRNPLTAARDCFARSVEAGEWETPSLIAGPLRAADADALVQAVAPCVHFCEMYALCVYLLSERHPACPRYVIEPPLHAVVGLAS